MGLIQTEDFSGGVTTKKRVRDGARQAMSVIDGFFVDTGSLVPYKGQSAISDEGECINIASALWTSVDRSSSSPVTSKYYIKMNDDGKTTPFSFADVSTVGNDWADGAILGDVLGLPAQMGDHFVVPTTGGMKRFDMNVITAPLWVTAHAYATGDIVRTSSTRYAYKCLIQHTSGIFAEDRDASKWQKIVMAPQLGVPAPVATPTPTVASNISAGLHSCDVDDWTASSDATIDTSVQQYLTGSGSLMFTLNNAIPTGTEIGYTSTLATSNLSAKTYLTASVYYTGQYPLFQDINPESSPLVITLYNGAQAVGCAWIPKLSHGWNRVVCPIEIYVGQVLTSITKMMLLSYNYTTTTPVTFYIDDIRAATDAELSDVVNATNEMLYYEYRMCYESPHNHTTPNPKSYLSNPSGLTKTSRPVGRGDQVVVTCTPDYSINDYVLSENYDITHVAYYRSEADIGVYTYVGRAPIEAPSFTDKFVYGDYNTANGLPKYMEANHDEPSTAKLIMRADSCLYAAGLDIYDSATGVYSRPLAIARSNWENERFWPTSSDGSNSADGGEFIVPAITGTEIRMLAKWRDIKLVILDTETFIMNGDNNANTSFTYVGPVGIGDSRSFASCSKMCIWQGGDGYFYTYAGGEITNISMNRIEPVDVITSGACIWKDKYIIEDYYSLIVYDINTDAWSTIANSGYGSIKALSPVVDNDTGILYAEGDAMRAVTLFDGTVYGSETVGTSVFTAKTSGRIIANAGTDSTLEYLQLDIENIAGHAIEVTYTVSVYGKAGVKTQTGTVDVVDGIIQYEIPLSDTLTGRVANVELQYQGSDHVAYPPTIHAINLVTVGKKQR